MFISVPFLLIHQPKSKSGKGDARGLWDDKDSLICPIFKKLGIITSPNTLTMGIITTEANKYLKELV